MVEYNLVWKRIEIPNFGRALGEFSTSKLTALLPTLVDKLTPEGKIPEAGLLQQGLNFLRSNLPKN